MAIDKLEPVAKLLISVGQKVEADIKAGFKVSSLLDFIPEFSQIPGLIQDKADIIAQFKALTSPDIASLLTYIEANLALTDVTLQAKVTAILKVGLDIIQLVQTFKA